MFWTRGRTKGVLGHLKHLICTGVCLLLALTCCAHELCCDAHLAVRACNSQRGNVPVNWICSILLPDKRQQGGGCHSGSSGSSTAGGAAAQQEGQRQQQQS
jgi:hypothetical protein